MPVMMINCVMQSCRLLSIIRSSPVNNLITITIMNIVMMMMMMMMMMMRLLGKFNQPDNDDKHLYLCNNKPLILHGSSCSSKNKVDKKITPKISIQNILQPKFFSLFTKFNPKTISVSIHLHGMSCKATEHKEDFFWFGAWRDLFSSNIVIIIAIITITMMVVMINWVYAIRSNSLFRGGLPPASVWVPNVCSALTS